MTTRISSFGEDCAVVLDAAILAKAQLAPGDLVEVSLSPDGAITISPQPQPAEAAEMSALIESTMSDYGQTMQRLA
jgi:antitoxin component of MazEF toxin-antitoxin module